MVNLQLFAPVGGYNMNALENCFFGFAKRSILVNVSNIPDVDLVNLAAALQDSYYANPRLHHISSAFMPSRDEIYAITNKLFSVLFPGFFGRQDLSHHNIAQHVQTELEGLSRHLYRQILQCFNCRKSRKNNNLELRAQTVTQLFLESLPRIREVLFCDILAAYKGDPAAGDTDEIIFSYPATIAIGTYRLAHQLRKLSVPLMPRIMTEHAHSLTGIDIHPGSMIGKGFFIDHGTGVVIGETAIIGDNCKLYQGVTLGALSFPHDESGQIIRNYKRHPTLEDEVIVYSNASILGNVTIGKGATIGGSVFLTQSVPPGCMVTAKQAELRYRNRCDTLSRGLISDYQI